jgi:peptidoglycan/LPS O-acetylase OafA/YrhL
VLRALAVGGVVVNHLFPERLPGGYLGVDIFFVISGFLITSHLTGELDRTGRLRLGRFWARRARRLLPAALLVLVVATAGTVAWLPQAKWNQIMHEVVASALYFQNWQLAGAAQDYFTSSQSPSPVTHYWSLSVEEQFYLVWPLLALLVWWVAGRVAAGVVDRRHVLAGVLGLVVLASWAFALWSSQAHPDSAYFVTPGRAWEFALGGALGALRAVPTLPRAVAWAGWVVMVGSMVTFGERSGVPGGLTWLPVLACLLVVWAGIGSGESGVRVLRPLTWAGDVSYSLYLWHWPLIVFAPYALGLPMSPGLAAGILVLTGVVAHLSTRYVEDPVRRGAWFASGPAWRSLAPAAVAMAVVAGLALAVPRTLAGDLDDVQLELEALVESGGACVGAASATRSCPDSHVLAVAQADLATIENSPYRPAWGSTCQVDPEDPEPAPCEFGVPPEEAERRIALVGDSHAGHWAATLDTIARQEQWNVVMQVKSSCAVVDGDWRAGWATEPMVDSCRDWGEQVDAALLSDPSIDTVVVSAISREYVTSAPDGGVAQLRQQWRRWTRAGKDVVVLGDPPALGHDSLPECLGRAGSAVDPCWAPRTVATSDPLMEAARGQRGVTAWSPLPYTCDRTRCHAVVGGLPVYGDQSHLLMYFARTLAPMLREVLVEEVTAASAHQPG